MAILNNTNFDFMVTMGNILKAFNDNPNVEMEDFKMDEFCDYINLNVNFKNDETARQDFFGFFESIGYTITEAHGCTEEDFYDTKEFPNGAIIIPQYVNLSFNAEVDEVVYEMKYWDIKSK